MMLSFLYSNNISSIDQNKALLAPTCAVDYFTIMNKPNISFRACVIGIFVLALDNVLLRMTIYFIQIDDLVWSRRHSGENFLFFNFS